MLVTFDHRDDIAPNIKTFWFKPLQKVHYTAGQFTEIYLPHEPADDRGIKRWFTLSSSPTEKLLSITTKFAPMGSTFKQTLLKLQPGTELNLADPMGDFVLPKDKDVPILFVAGGMGVTPMRSMTKWLTDEHEQRDITMLYAVSHPEDMVFRDLFSSYYAERFVPICTKPGTPWDGLEAELTTELILEYVNDRSRTMVYLAGPEPMVEKLSAELEQKGIDKRLIVTDFFPGYTSV